MTELFKTSYFYLLPNEVLIKILSDIDSVTLVNFCEIYNCDYFLQDRNVIKTINLQRNYLLNDLSQISKHITFEYVTVLNINCVYWIQASKLRKFVSRLVNLETLYALHTNLSLNPDNTGIFKTMKIKKLGISIKRNEDVGPHKLPTVEVLYLSIVNVGFLLNCFIDNVFPELKKMWIDIEEPNGRESFLHRINAQTKNKIFFQVNAPLVPINFDHYCLTTYYSNLRARQPYVVCCERMDAKSANFQFQSEGWKVLDELHYSKPYGPKDARRLHLKESPADFHFDELNFDHDGPVCVERCRDAIREILVSKNAKHLKRLCVRMCLLENKKGGPSFVENSIGFKRKRRGIENLTESHSAEDMFKNFLDLEELVVLVCTHTALSGTIQALPLIGYFENLRSLTIEVPVISDGSFFSEVFMKCKYLERVKISTISQNEKLNFNLCNSIPLATSLKDFRYDNHRIHLDKLLERLSSIQTQKLERIVLYSTEVDKFSVGPFTAFLDKNPQLIFLYFCIKDITKKAQQMAQSTLKLYKKQHPAKVFFVKNKDVFDKMGYPIPDVHFCEMVKSDNNIGTLCALEDFEFF